MTKITENKIIINKWSENNAIMIFILVGAGEVLIAGVVRPSPRTCPLWLSKVYTH